MAEDNSTTKFAETRHILFGHVDEVWNLEWSPGGSFIASGGKDGSAIIWRRKLGSEEWESAHVLRHEMPVSCLAWSADESILLTSSEFLIFLWEVKSGECLRTLEEVHSETITSLLRLPNESGYISGGIDRKIVHWDSTGNCIHQWYPGNIRILSMDLVPNEMQLAIVGLQCSTMIATMAVKAKMKAPVYQIMIYSLLTRRTQKTLKIEEGSTSIIISRDARHALVNSRNEISLWDLKFNVKTGRYMGHKNRKDLLRSCFSGETADRFILSGSEDGRIFVWNRLTGILQSVLRHGAANNGNLTVSAVTWHPLNEKVFASCSDDHTVRLWETL
ncbi:WD40 repeat-like protein [Gymnopus androsaceus JB14]|uniref:WD40 repeat-like protein n=1 Tax=Gymnopus androsaceus JB14 TaxID=1447944 RepID=A0A6A4GY66_9AGAR|nr:WD40 repeat-like protein [Gymnopus androsaceus JB14]